jgi:hypothetical protein
MDRVAAEYLHDRDGLRSNVEAADGVRASRH